MSNKKLRKNVEASWSGLVLLVVVAMLIGIYFLRIDTNYDLVPYNIDPNLVVYKSNIAKAAEDVDKIKVYSNNNFHFKTNYLQNWSEKEEINGKGDNEIFTVTFSNINKLMSISVMETIMEGIVRNSVNIDKETEIIINNKKAQRIDGGNSKDGSDITIILLKNEKKLYVLKGFGQEFEDMLNNFQIY